MIGDTIHFPRLSPGTHDWLAHQAGEVADMVNGSTKMEWFRTLADGTMERWGAEIHGLANDWSDLELTFVRVVEYGLIDADGCDVAEASCRWSDPKTLAMLAERCWDAIEDDYDLRLRIARDIWDRR